MTELVELSIEPSELIKSLEYQIYVEVNIVASI